MRNKQQFLDDAAKVVKEEFKEELNVVEDAAHIMNQKNEPIYTIPKDFTSTGKDEVFLFEVEPRPKTDNPDEEIDDYHYKGRGE
ncbi:hypothetical protein JZO72_03635 [Vagococcus fluvialis]|uniref:DUF5960 family protein n=1 Tax=Vagococcus fluvialis TaxID=2738 RepID=UPI001A8F3207|nr:DUF5960 family protein [Vagococcus fluvialis]MBO0478712.1 hypothetical protein [Vagococcus fluvialis]MBO0484443.1 hypothetical protein [Vagococcus fluvialis]